MIVHCPHCSGRFDVAELLLLPSGRKLKCSKCQQVFFQAAPPPPTRAPVPSRPPESLEEDPDFQQFAADSAREFLDGEQDQGDEIPLSSDEMQELMGLSHADHEDWEDGDSHMDELGISNETLVALEQEERRQAPRKLAADDDADEGSADRTMFSLLDDAYPDLEDEEDETSASMPRQPNPMRKPPVFGSEEVDLPESDLPTLVAGNISGNKTGDKKSSAKAAPPREPEEPDFDSLIDSLESNKDLEEIDLDADTYVVPRSKSPTPDKLSDDEEEALASLGFNPGLSHDEETALGELGFHNRTELKGLTDGLEDEEDFAPISPHHPEPPPLTKGESKPVKSKRSLKPVLWMLVVALAVLFGGSVIYTRTGFKEWWEFKRFDMGNYFRIVSLESKWIEKDFGQVLMVTGVITNTTSMAHTMPVVKILLMNENNQPVAETRVVPGRLISAKDLEAGQETLRAITVMQGETKRIKPGKLFPNKDAEMHAIFLNPPENAMRFQAEFDSIVEESPKAKGSK